MRRWIRRAFMGLCRLVLAMAMTGVTYQWLASRGELTATPPPGRLVDIGGYRLHLWCTGDGAPAVILDAGLGGTSAGWGFVQPDVARFTRVCSYDRAGMGYSDPGPSPRTARRVARELAELLARSGIASERGCVITAQQSGHVVAIDEPQVVVVDAIHTVVEIGRGQDVPLCATLAANDRGKHAVLWRHSPTVD